MIPLLVLTSLLLIASGAVKLRAAARGGLGLHVLSLLELALGVGLGVLLVGRPLSPGQGLGAAGVAVVLIVLSSLHIGKALGHKRRLRNLTEGRRLEVYLQGRPGTHSSSSNDVP